MQARDGPEMKEPVENSGSKLPEFSAAEAPPFVTRHETPVSRSELMPKRTKSPTRTQAKKPPCAPGFFWRSHGAGWDLRRDTYVTSHDGVRKRKQPFIAHLSKTAFAEMKRRHRGAALERAILDWISSHDK